MSLSHPRRLTLIGLSLLLSCAAAETKTEPSAKIKEPPQSNGFVFSLLPTSLQSNPATDMSVICEMTDEGRKRPVVTPSHPSTFIAFNGGYKSAGEDQNTIKPRDVVIEQALVRALSVNGFKHVSDKDRPDLALIYHWGSHAIDYSGETLGGILSRSMLIGGAKFTKEFKEALEAQSKNWTVSNVEAGADDTGPTVTRASTDMAMEAMKRAAAPSPVASDSSGNGIAESIERLAHSMTPLERFKARDRRTGFLVEQCLRGIYFVIVSAFDYQAMAHGKKVLLWRARITIDSTGVSIQDAIPSLLAHSGAFLGRDMDVPATATPKLLRGEAKVEVGETKVIGDAKEK